MDVQALATRRGSNLERVVVLFKLDPIGIEKALLSKQWGYIVVDEYNGCRKYLRMILQAKVQFSDKTWGVFHRNADDVVGAAAGPIDAEQLGHVGGQDDVVGTGINNRQKRVRLFAPRNLDLDGRPFDEPTANGLGA